VKRDVSREHLRQRVADGGEDGSVRRLRERVVEPARVEALYRRREAILRVAQLRPGSEGTPARTRSCAAPASSRRSPFESRASRSALNGDLPNNEARIAWPWRILFFVSCGFRVDTAAKLNE